MTTRPDNHKKNDHKDSNHNIADHKNSIIQSVSRIIPLIANYAARCLRDANVSYLITGCTVDFLITCLVTRIWHAYAYTHARTHARTQAFTHTRSYFHTQIIIVTGELPTSAPVRASACTHRQTHTQTNTHTDIKVIKKKVLHSPNRGERIRTGNSKFNT